MRRAGLFFVCLLLALLSTRVVVAEDAPTIDPAGRVGIRFVEGGERPAEGLPLRTVRYVGERVRVYGIIEIDRSWFDQYVVQRFRRQLDLPIEITAPWASAPAPPQHADETTISTALNGNAATLIPVDRNTATASYALATDLTFDKAGTIDLPIRVLLSYASRFEEDFLGKRTPVDPKEHTYRLDGPTLEVRAVPTAGRPDGHVDAVGNIEATAQLSELAGGERLALRIELLDTGRRPSGNLDRAALPFATQLEGFHVFGVQDDAGFPKRTLIYELAPDHRGVTSVPPLVFHSFDPVAQAFVTTRTMPLPVPRSALASAALPEPMNEAPKATPVEVMDDAECLLACGIVLLVLLVSMGYIGYRVYVRRKRRPATGSADDRRARAWAALVMDMNDGTLGEYLAASLDCPRAALVDQGLAERLINEAGFAPELATRAAGTYGALLAARYGGEAVDGDRTRVLLASLGAHQRVVAQDARWRFEPSS